MRRKIENSDFKGRHFWSSASGAYSPRSPAPLAERYFSPCTRRGAGFALMGDLPLTWGGRGIEKAGGGHPPMGVLLLHIFRKVVISKFSA